MVRALCFHCWGPGSVFGWGTKILQATRHSQREKKRESLVTYSEVILGKLRGRLNLLYSSPSCPFSILFLLSLSLLLPYWSPLCQQVSLSYINLAPQAYPSLKPLFPVSQNKPCCVPFLGDLCLAHSSGGDEEDSILVYKFIITKNGITILMFWQKNHGILYFIPRQWIHS